MSGHGSIIEKRAVNVVAGNHPGKPAWTEADLVKLQQPETIARIRAKRATRHGRGPLPGLDPEIAQ